MRYLIPKHLSQQPELYEKFETLFREQYSRLADYAYSIVKNKQDAEDVVQDVFIKIWQNKQGMIDNDGIKFYLLTATKNTCISLLRKQSVVIFPGDRQNEIPQLPDEDMAANAPVDYAALVNEAFTLLPPQCLAIFKMSRLANLTYAQIAAELGLSVKTIENQMGKALRIMREYARNKNISLPVLCLLLFRYLGAFHSIA